MEVGHAPVRTLFLSSCVLGGGAGWSLYYLLKHLDRRRFDPLVVLPPGGIFEEKLQELGVPVVTPRLLHHRTAQLRFERRNPLTAAMSYGLNAWDSAHLVSELVSIVGRERVRLIHCNNMMVKTVGAVAAQRTGTPCVFHVRNLHDRLPKALLYGNLARLPIVKRVVANSAASARPYEQFVPQKVTVIHNGVDLDEYHPHAVPRGSFRRKAGIDSSAVVVGFTGLLTPRKGLEPLMHAAARLLAGRRDLVFVAAGREPVGSMVPYRARYEALAGDLGIADRFRFVGFHGDVRPIVLDCDVLVLPSLQEPFGRSVIEAMALGTAVIASRVGGIPEIIDHETHGLLVPPGDVDALASAIGTLVDDPTRRRALATAALARVRGHFDISMLSLALQDVLLEAVAA
ncbi:MAG: hypothetical protein A3F69_01030 [Acidobacteria bacterium RIFCSPLOWO2_12_FULL_66_10]|nr:MAG: hypothetical protein A3F69_01030 [Acidobacteria bacterium RIFCSPLOWO2_12_FULL_66_10]